MAFALVGLQIALREQAAEPPIGRPVDRIGQNLEAVGGDEARAGQKPDLIMAFPSRNYVLAGELPNALFPNVPVVFVADSDAEAMKLSVGSYMGRMMREYFLPLLGQFGFLEYLKHDPGTADSDVTPEYCARHNWIVGSPKTVVDKIEKIYDEVGGFGQLLVFGFDYADNPQAWRHSLELLSKEVLPKVQHLKPKTRKLAAE